MSMSGLSSLSHLTFSMPCTTSMPFSTRPKTVCLLSSHGAGAVAAQAGREIRRAPEGERWAAGGGVDHEAAPWGAERGGAWAGLTDEELRSVSARPCVGHGQCEGPVVAERAVELVLELVAPDGGAARAIAKRVAGLHHEPLDDAVKDDAVVIPARRKEASHASGGEAR